MSEKYVFNAGQKRMYSSGEAPAVFPQTPYVKAPVIEGLPQLEIHPAFADRGYVVMSDVAEELVGITPAMLDWWFANMEKGYPLWAPGEHYGFDWVVPPCEVGYEGSVEAAYEFRADEPLLMTRVSIKEYPFTECYSHCWLGAFQLGPVSARLVHMYDATLGGTVWRSVIYMTADNMELMKQEMANMPNLPDHMQYESGRFRYFLPQLYALWQGHPDPWQNVQYDLTTQKTAEGTWEHKYDNKPAAK